MSEGWDENPGGVGMKKALILLPLLAFRCSLFASDVRPAAVAGQFYPADPGQLTSMVDRFLAEAHPKEITGNLVAIVVPHAGYVYSGPVAAYAYKRIGKNWKTVVLLGLAHQTQVHGASVWSRGAFETPLGRVGVDEALAREILASSKLFEDTQAPHVPEHSIEVQLPFLQKVLGDFQMVPILMNNEDAQVENQIGQALARVLRKRKALLVISSDMSHYPDRDTARRVDHTTLAALERMDPDYFRLTSKILLDRQEKNLHCTWCGESGLMAGLEAAKGLGANHAVVLRYMNSGEVPRYGDPDRAVGYAAVAFMREGQTGGTFRKRSEPRLTPTQRTSLLAQARQSIADALAGKSFEPPPLADDPVMNLPAAVFVTLTERGALRGCIGTTEPRSALLEAVRYFARAAAFEDRRFRPVAKDELGKLHIEISILSPMEPVPSAEVIVPGKHGVVVRKDYRSGLFLPTVWEQLPDKTEFLSEVCSQKAGLPPDCWKDPSVKLSVFTTEVFEEPK
jgi:AmmeMemoRadiSam system protein B/AmmeMemoRadiSam system protein A